MAAGSVRKRKRRGRSNTRQQGSNSTKLQGCDNKCKRFKNPRKIYTEQEPRARTKSKTNKTKMVLFIFL
jgi:hypothetical protein